MAKKEAKFEQLTDDEARTMQIICDNVAHGVGLFELCEEWKVSYGPMHRWVVEDPDREKMYRSANDAAADWLKATVFAELRKIATVDLRLLYDENGKLRPIGEWPDGPAKAVASVDTFEEFAGRGEDRLHVGDTKKVKLFDKLRALELMGKTASMFIDKVEHNGVLSIADELKRARDRKDREEDKRIADAQKENSEGE